MLITNDNFELGKDNHRAKQPAKFGYGALVRWAIPYNQFETAYDCVSLELDNPYRSAPYQRIYGVNGESSLIEWGQGYVLDMGWVEDPLKLGGAEPGWVYLIHRLSEIGVFGKGDYGFYDEDNLCALPTDELLSILHKRMITNAQFGRSFQKPVLAYNDDFWSWDSCAGAQFVQIGQRPKSLLSTEDDSLQIPVPAKQLRLIDPARGTPLQISNLFTRFSQQRAEHHTKLAS